MAEEEHDRTLDAYLNARSSLADSDAFREQYQAFRSGSAKGAASSTAGICSRSSIRTDHPLARSAILSSCSEADALRAKFEASEWGRVAAASLLEGTQLPPMSTTDNATTDLEQHSSRILGLSLAALLCGSCCQLCVELLVRHDGRTGNLISASEYVYCALFSSSALFRERKLPWRCHLALLAAGVAHSALTNAGLAMRELPMSVALVIKNGSLLANLLVGGLVGQRPSKRDLIAAAWISLGLCLGAVSCRSGGSSGQSSAEVAERELEGMHGLVGRASSLALGVGCLSGALLARAASGVGQESIFRKHGVAYNEVLFWRAALGAPIFLAANFWESVLAVNGASLGEGSPSVLSQVLSSRWLLALLITNVVGDHITKLSVTRLIGEAGSLTATLVIQLQRFASCIFSATVLADHPPSATLWLAIGCVACGSLASIQPKDRREKEKKR